MKFNKLYWLYLHVRNPHFFYSNPPPYEFSHLIKIITFIIANFSGIIPVLKFFFNFQTFVVIFFI